jgi:hypothetical protein
MDSADRSRRTTGRRRAHGAHWPIVLVLGLCALLVCAWLEYLRYLVDITAVRFAMNV